MAAPLPPPTLRHFWDRDTAAFTGILHVLNKGPRYDQEDVVQHMWNAIFNLYYGSIAVHPFAPRWTVIREPYRGLPPLNLSQKKPDVVAVVAKFQQAIGLQHRDTVWVECKAPNHDTPSRWKNLINEATVRLNNAHPTRRLFIIFAVGLKLMVFLWLPQAAGGVGLTIRGHGRNWTLDPRIQPLHPSPWYNAAAHEVVISQAIVLDCFTRTPGGTLQNWPMLQWLHSFLIFTSQVTFPGMNPGIW